jgi:two-component system, OmpR family, alkaline phosphatase synthesis response regulator PhoP
MDSRAVLTALQWEEPRLMVSSQGLPVLRRRVLVVDDESAIREVLATFLEQYEFAVHTVPDGASALALLQTEYVDVILVDLQMPGISGLEMAVEVRKTNPYILMALITGSPMAIQPASLRQAGISRVFAKPFDLEALIAWLQTLSLRGPETLSCHSIPLC